MRRELICPELTIVSAVIDKAVAPALRDIEKEIVEALPTIVTVWLPNLEGPKILVTGQGILEAVLESAPKGEMRLSFRQTAIEGRLLFFGETVYQQSVSPKLGFSGFDLRGSLRIQPDNILVEDESWTIKYNVWRFRGWR